MKKNLLISITLFFFATFAQKSGNMTGQVLTSEEWNEKAKTDFRLLPKYGHLRKTAEQKKSDQEFIETVLKKDSSNRKASDHLIRLGFNYLYRDIKTAMYRFNQAYLLDSTNTDIYWGFGGVYMTLGNYAEAEKQYVEGLTLNPNNPHLLTDYGTCFLATYYALLPKYEKEAVKNLNNAITKMVKSYEIDPTDQNTVLKISICYWNKGDCDNAWKYYNICKSLGGKPITEDYTNDLQKKCKQKK